MTVPINIDFFRKNGYQIFENVIEPETIARVKQFCSERAHIESKFAKRKFNCKSDSEFVKGIGAFLATRNMLSAHQEHAVVAALPPTSPCPTPPFRCCVQQIADELV